MKYPNWETYTEWLDRVTLEVNSDIDAGTGSNEQKQNAVKQELRLDTHNGTTKDDLLNTIRYMDGENNRLKRAVDKLREENERLRIMLEEAEIEGEEK